MAYQGGWSGGGAKRAPAPRAKHGPAHELNPRFEDILRETRNLAKQYRTHGSQPSRDTVLFDSDPERQPISVPHAAMILKQCGIPLTHPQYPPICKFDTSYQDGGYYLSWCGPVEWEHDSDFRYIPGYTRYVIDKFGRVLNAYNGTPVTPEKGGYAYRLVGDGPANFNDPRYANKDNLLMLAWSALPEGFIDFGVGTYSHSLSFDKEKGVYGWVARPEIKVRDRRNQETKLYPNLPMFIESAVEDFQQKNQFREYVRNGMGNQTVGIGDFDVKLASEVEEPGPVPQIGRGSTSAVQHIDEAGFVPQTQQSAPVAAQSEPEVIDFDTLDF